MANDSVFENTIFFKKFKDIFGCIKEYIYIMNSLKAASINIIQRLPDTCSLDDIMYQINLISQILEGYKDSEEEKTISTEELLQKVEKWVK